MDPIPGVLRVHTGYESDVDNDDEFAEPLSATLDDAEEKDWVKETFDTDIDDAIELAKSVSTDGLSSTQRKQRFDQFVEKRKGNWNGVTFDDHNFLHDLAYVHRKSTTKLQWLMSRVMLKLPHLMGRLDNTRRTPLTIALAAGNEAFSHAACFNLRPTTQQRFKEPLKIECANTAAESDTTCLHTALVCPFKSEDQRQRIVKQICDFVPTEVFTYKNSRGRTPLHLAIEYERCYSGQSGVVEKLLHCGLQALDVAIPVTLYSNSSYSVYQYHMSTRRQFENKTLSSEEHRRKHLQLTAKNTGSSETRSTPNVQKSSMKGEKSIMGPPALPKDRVDARIDSATFTASSHGTTSAVPYATALDREQETSRYTPSVSSETAGLRKSAANISAPRQEASSANAQIDRDRQVEFDAIGILLKVFYLRTHDPERAARALNVHGKSGKELWFDFGPPKKLTKADFRKHFKHLQFDSVLQYVAFPQQIELDDHTQNPDPRFAGRKDMLFFFEWLRKQGVQKIIKVIVDDLTLPSHSDETIETSLKSFKVEILDWRRLDLDSLSLCEIGECLREVNLYWSGNNAILRAWSAWDGLAKLPMLEIINLHQNQGTESAIRTERNLDDFEKRLYQFWPKVKPPPKVNRPKSGGGRRLIRGQSVDTLPERQERPVDPHRWMQTMGSFSEHFRQLSVLQERVTDPWLEPIEVALIDDGADITRSDLGNIKGEKFTGKSFCYYQDGSTRRVSPYWDSSSGHGTLMARLIHKICPSAIIHVIKLQTFAVENSDKLQINPDSAIKAIEYAAERGAQIISTSWTIKPPEGEKKKEFDDAVHNAINSKGILMFCAASDQGKSADLTYPYGSNRGSFRIGAAKSSGSMAETVGDAHELDFIFPGHQVVVGGNDDSYDNDLQKLEAHSGSSVATALAAGLAALIIECVRLGIFYTNMSKLDDPSMAIRKDDLARIRDRGVMQAAMESIGTSRNTDGRYIEVWRMFDKAAEDLRLNDGSSIDQLAYIANLARHFLHKVRN